jgi:hypothetical protein
MRRSHLCFTFVLILLTTLLHGSLPAPAFAQPVSIEAGPGGEEERQPSDEDLPDGDLGDQDLPDTGLPDTDLPDNDLPDGDLSDGDLPSGGDL